MPYNRYDVVNRYDRKGKRKNEHFILKTVLLIVIPIVIIGVVALGIFLGYKSAEKKEAIPEATVPATYDEAVTYVSDEELLRVVNDSHMLDESFVPSLKPFAGVSVSEYVVDSLDDMISAAYAEGISITLSEGYVSYSDQGKRYEATYSRLMKDNNYSEVRAEAETKKISPEAGCSESQTGMLLMLSTDEKSFEKSKAFKWLERNAVNYGFILRYPKDKEDSTGMYYNPQLYRYVGVEHALNMRRYGMTLNDYASHIAQQ